MNENANNAIATAEATATNANAAEAVNVQTIKVIVKHCKTKDGKKQFDAYRAVQKDGTLIDCRFRMAVTGIPKENFIMRVARDQWNISKKYEYPRLWVSSVLEFMPVTPAQTEETADDLPF